MPEVQQSGERSSSRSSSFEKGFQDYPLTVLEHETDTDSSHLVLVGRESSDVRPDAATREPLLPTSTPNLNRQQPPEKFSCSISGIRTWVKGPFPPFEYKITPWLGRWQTAPARYVEHHFPSARAKVLLLVACITVWGVVFVSLLHSSITGQELAGYGVPVKLSCHSRLWYNSTECGLNGETCLPFDNGGFAFRCPASCKDAILLEPYVVGPQEYNYRPLVIGGSFANKSITDSPRNLGIYRGDSAICPAALHAGLADDQTGGCGVLRRTGEHSDYPSILKNGIRSIGFPSSFPLSFTFEADPSGGSSCRDQRWMLFTFSLITTILLSLFTTSSASFFASVYFIVFFQVALSSDPPYSPSYLEIVSTALGRFLPCAIVGWAMYHFVVRRTLHDLSARWDQTILWLGPCWVGALNTDTFDKIPISRLTPHDIQQQPGAIPALIIIVACLVLIVLTQALAFRKEGRLPQMLTLYAIFLGAIIVLLLVPDMNLRIHHYILSLLFLPGTALRTRPSLVYQGLLVGLFINGIARWGFDSILQTSAALLEGAQLGSVLPAIGAPVVLGSDQIAFAVRRENLVITNGPDTSVGDGISILVNDVERYRSFWPELLDGEGADAVAGAPAGAGEGLFNWTRRVEGEDEYFRFAFVRLNALGGFWYEDFTKPVVWTKDGLWKAPEELEKKTEGGGEHNGKEELSSN
ncbi:LCCL domain protein [Aspergillus saccharolyticus JOP 1030-1]|uniref:LCCL domain protein n=1 Tax=Aspergillus saccharolyticus JOP 1030-1 TaxID=1450539 RepID=A0A318ZXB2_9EURO|nr:LCCL domain protein [Aspergillus saccharolyticus JOP 1030-1]PYH48953.1 LCCL domain protein [Aspergillus saccharolyticus JOP 1030-1]